jgi:hypothetical protein
MIYPKDFFADNQVKNDDLFSTFVIMPFSKEFDIVYKKGIKSLIDKMGLGCIRADELFRPKPIMEDILKLISESGIIIADVTNRNANVFYELGISHSIKDFVIIISQSIDDVPFDLRHIRCLIYTPSNSGLMKLQLALYKTILQVFKEEFSGYITQSQDTLKQGQRSIKKLIDFQSEDNGRFSKEINQIINGINSKVNQLELVNIGFQRLQKKFSELEDSVSQSSLTASIKEFKKTSLKEVRKVARLLRKQASFEKDVIDIEEIHERIKLLE